MKVKTSELTCAALDWAVAKCEEPIGGYKAWVQRDLDNGIAPAGVRADDWLTAGPIIEREKIAMWPDEEGGYFASANEGSGADFHGPTPLIAAMRCYVASKLGDEVEVPDELAR